MNRLRPQSHLIKMSDRVQKLRPLRLKNMRAFRPRTSSRPLAKRLKQSLYQPMKQSLAPLRPRPPVYMISPSGNRA